MLALVVLLTGIAAPLHFLCHFFSDSAFLFCHSDLTFSIACRGHPERGEAVADDGGARRAAGAAREAQVLRQGEPQADQSVSGNHTTLLLLVKS